MRPIRTLLVAIDFSETSTRALEYAHALAGQLDASLTVAHFFEWPTFGADGTLPTIEEFDRLLRVEVATRVEALAARKSVKPPVAVSSVVRRSVDWEGINALAEELDADLVVVGTHGRRGVRHALIGSVAEKVVRTSQRPVLTVGPEQQVAR